MCRSRSFPLLSASGGHVSGTQVTIEGAKVTTVGGKGGFILGGSGGKGAKTRARGGHSMEEADQQGMRRK